MDGENVRNESQSLKLLSETLNRCADDFESVWRDALDEQQSAEIHAHLTQVMQVQRRMLQDWMRRISSGEFPLAERALDGAANTVVVPPSDDNDELTEPPTIVSRRAGGPEIAGTSSVSSDDHMADAEAETEHRGSFALRPELDLAHGDDCETWAYAGTSVNPVYVLPEVEGYEILGEVGRGGVVRRARCPTYFSIINVVAVV